MEADQFTQPPTRSQPIRTVQELRITPDNPPWNGWVAIGYWILSVVFIVVVPSAFLVPYLVSKGLDLSNREALMQFLFSDQTVEPRERLDAKSASGAWNPAAEVA